MMVDSLAAQAKNNRLAKFAAYAFGQLQSLNADARVCLEHPNVVKHLPRQEIARGRADGLSWLADLEARYLQDLPEHLARRGERARTAAHLLGSESIIRQGTSS